MGDGVVGKGRGLGERCLSAFKRASLRPTHHSSTTAREAALASRDFKYKTNERKTKNC